MNIAMVIWPTIRGIMALPSLAPLSVFLGGEGPPAVALVFRAHCQIPSAPFRSNESSAAGYQGFRLLAVMKEGE